MLAHHDERSLLLELDQWLAELTPGVIATWNGAGVRPALPGHPRPAAGCTARPATRARPHARVRHGPLPGHDGAYRASWHGHTHLDAYRVFRADVGRTFGLSCSLKSVAGLVGLQPVEVDASRVHELPRRRWHGYVASDARCTARARPAPVGHGVGRRSINRREPWHDCRRGRGRRPASADLDVELRCRQTREPRRLRLLRAVHGTGHLQRRHRQSAADRRLDPVPRRPPDGRRRALIEPNSVALVVTSPPYFAGKEYEEALGEGHIPASYVEYLDMLRDVFAECAEKLEPGGRIAVNVANLGRKPYRSLSADVIRILQDDLGLLLRGEIIWRKAEGSVGQLRVGLVPERGQPGAPRPHRAGDRRVQGPVRSGRCPKRPRSRRGLPFENTIAKDDFMDLDHRRVGVPRRERQPGRPPRAVPGRAPPTPDRALHLPRRPRARSVHGLGLHRRRRRQHPPPLRRLRHR